MITQTSAKPDIRSAPFRIVPGEARRVRAAGVCLFCSGSIMIGWLKKGILGDI
jgi:hypothetical protein